LKAPVDNSDGEREWRTGSRYGSVASPVPACDRRKHRGARMTESTAPTAPRSLLDRYFGLSEHGTTPRTEMVAGVTTFLTMAYIIFVNPTILANAGMDRGAVFVATCVAAAVSTLAMGLYANYPIALAPGMGLNAFFAFTVVITYKYTWQQALAAVFLSGVLFFLISVFPIRQYVVESIPHNLKLAISAGVGLFLGIIALQTSGLVVDHPATLVTLGDMKKPAAILAILGFVLIVALNHRNIIGGTLIGILVVALIGIPFGLTQYQGIVSLPPSLGPTFLQMDFSRAFELTFLIVVFTILLIDVFDNAGTLIGVTHRTGLMVDGKLPRMREALIADSFAAMFGAAIGTSTTTSYIESAAGVSAGGRTGLTAVVVAILFLCALFFAPLAGMIPAYASAAALLFVACMMARGLAELSWDDLTEYAPAVVTAITMPLTYSIATGIGLGFITYAVIKILSGRVAEASPAVVVLAILFAVKFAVAG
jgi:AGZA family xanthine/uracil permease-like MFS transporter